MKRSERKSLLAEAQKELQITRKRSARVTSLVTEAGFKATALARRREENGFAKSLRMIFEGAPRSLKTG